MLLLEAVFAVTEKMAFGYGSVLHQMYDPGLVTSSGPLLFSFLAVIVVIIISLCFNFGLSHQLPRIEHQSLLSSPSHVTFSPT